MLDRVKLQHKQIESLESRTSFRMVHEGRATSLTPLFRRSRKAQCRRARTIFPPVRRCIDLRRSVDGTQDMRQSGSADGSAFTGKFFFALSFGDRFANTRLTSLDWTVHLQLLLSHESYRPHQHRSLDLSSHCTLQSFMST